MPKHTPVDIRLEAVRLYRDHKTTLRAVAKRYRISRNTLARWLQAHDPQLPFVSFLPIAIEESGDRPDNAPPVTTPIIPVAITTGTGSTVHVHLHSFDEIAALIRSLEKPC